MFKFFICHLQGSAFAALLILANGTLPEVLLAWMVGVSFNPRHLWPWF